MPDSTKTLRRSVHCSQESCHSADDNAKFKGQACLAPLLLAHLLDVQVSADHAEHVQVLSLVFMNTLDLNIVQGIGGHLSPCDFLQALRTNSSQCVVLSYCDNKHTLMLSHMHLHTITCSLQL